MTDLIVGIMRPIERPKKKRRGVVTREVPGLPKQVQAAAGTYKARTGRKASVVQIAGFGTNGNVVAGHAIKNGRVAGLDVVGGPGRWYMLVGEFVHALEEAG